MGASHPFYGLPTVGAGVSDSIPSGAPKALPIESAIMKFSVELKYELGSIHPIIGPRKSPSAWNEASPFEYFPAIPIDLDATLSNANWPELVPFLRGIKLEHGGGTSFSVTGWVVASNQVTLTFTNAAKEIEVLQGLQKDFDSRGVHRTITVPALGAAVPAGTYLITGLNSDPGSRTLTFAYTTGNTSGGAVSVEFNPYRIVGSISTAKWFAVSGAGLTTPGGLAKFVNGLGTLGFMQGHRHDSLHQYFVTGNSIANGPGSSGIQGAYQDATTGDPATDGTNGNPRIGSETHGPSMVVQMYLGGRRYQV